MLITTVQINKRYLYSIYTQWVGGTSKIGLYKYEIINEEGDTKYVVAEGNIKHKRDLGALKLVHKVIADYLKKEKHNELRGTR